MCVKFLKPFKGETFTGYKIVVKFNKKYYSPMSGIEYLPGPVPVIEFSRPLVEGHTFLNGKLTDLRGYLPHYKGYTAVFINKSQATIEKSHMRVNYPYHLMVIEMTISGELMTGDYGGDPVICGKNIIRIKHIK